ncbi:hypothetical protein ACLB1R_06370 [Escherichia coli]
MPISPGQRNHLENVANALDKHLQYNVDKTDLFA